MSFKHYLTVAVFGCSLATNGAAVRESFSDSGNPQHLDINVLNANLIVIGVAQPDVSVTFRSWPRNLLDESIPEASLENLGKAPSQDRFSISEQNNRMRVSFNGIHNEDTLQIFVPQGTALKISLTGGRAVAVRGSASDIEVQCTVGDIILDQIRGPVSVNTLDGDIDARFVSITPGKPNYLSSLNGDIHLSVPKKSEHLSFELDFLNGEVETSFPITLMPESNVWKVNSKGSFESSRSAATSRKLTHFRIKNHNGNININDN